MAIYIQRNSETWRNGSASRTINLVVNPVIVRTFSAVNAMSRSVNPGKRSGILRSRPFAGADAVGNSWQAAGIPAIVSKSSVPGPVILAIQPLGACSAAVEGTLAASD